MLNVYSGMLKMMDDFRDDGAEVEIQYLLDADYKQLHNTYNLCDVAGVGGDFDKAVNLLEWISANIYHCGTFGNEIKDTATDLLGYSFSKGTEKGINCRCLSIALTECLLAIGIKARTIYILPFSPYDFDNHVVCEAWLDDLGKWVMLDPSYNLYATCNDTPLSVIELRQAFANKENITFNTTANYNGNSINKDDLMTYYAKDLFWFSFSDVQGFNVDDSRQISVAPIGYDVNKFKSTNEAFRTKESGKSEGSRALSESENFVIYKGLSVLS